jgi:DNA polymerase-3 subunit delta
VFYIFHGDDEFRRTEELARLRAKLAGGDAAMATLNTSVLDGSQLTLGELRHACDSIPFMADRRLVIVHGLLSRLAPQSSGEDDSAWKRDFLSGLLTYLPNLPDFTRLFFLERKALSSSHPILKLAKAEREKDRGFIKLFELPKEGDLPAWIHQRAWDSGGSIDSDAAFALAALVGRDLRLLDLEIDKLLLYADGRTVHVDDVRTLVSRARDANIFDLVDAVGRREPDRALRLLHGLLDDRREPLYLLAMLARQVRILIQVSELQKQRLNKQKMVSRLKLHPFVIEKGLAQARNFEMAQLESAHQRLVETDLLIKTGKLDGVLALDLLVVDLCST